MCGNYYESSRQRRFHRFNAACQRGAPYKRYVLEVTDSNQVALSLYQKLGFREIERKSEIDAEEKGFSDRIYMEWRKPVFR